MVATGIPIEELSSPTALVTPAARVREALRYLFHRAGDLPSAGGGHVADALLMIAKHHAKLPTRDIEPIKKWSKPLHLKYDGMTEKNRTTIRLLMDPVQEALLLALPAAYMADARSLRLADPRKAFSIAMRAVAVDFLTKIPLRQENLTKLRLDKHLRRDDPRNGLITHLVILPGEVKTDHEIMLPIGREASRIIDEFIRHYRDAVASNDCVYLFPGLGTGNTPITKQGMRDAVKVRLEGRSESLPLPSNLDTSLPSNG
jgi:hypothetical protein